MTLLRRVLAVLLLLAPLAAARAQAPAAPPPQAAALTAADIERLTSLLQDEARRAEFLRTLEALAAAARARPGVVGEGMEAPEAQRPALRPAGALPLPQAAPAAAAPAPTAPAASPRAAPAAAEGTDATEAAPPPPRPAPAPAPAPTAAPAAPPPPATPDLIAPNTVTAQIITGLSGRMGAVNDAILTAIRSMADLPALWSSAIALAGDPVAQTRLRDASWKLGLLLALGLLAEAAAVRLLGRLRRMIEAAAAGTDTWLRRTPLVIARLLLDALPIAAFGIVVYAVFPLLQPLPTTRLVGLMAANVYMGARGAVALARMLLSPASDHLRLIPCSDAAAAYGVRWLRRLMLVGLGGYALAEAGLLFGLPWRAYDSVVNLTLLVISVLLARIVLQQQDAVAALLRADPLPPEEDAAAGAARRLLRGARDRLAEVWHILVILWLVASWTVWALAIEDGFRRMAVGTVLTLVILAVAKALEDGVAWLLAWLAEPGDAESQRWPGLQARAAGYLPAIRAVFGVALYVGATVLLLETWGLDSLAWFNEGTVGRRLIDTLMSIGGTLVAAVVLWEFANSAIQRRLTRLAHDSHAARSARVRTLLPMLQTVLGGVILSFVVLNALAQLGVNVAPLLAGAGVVGLAIGFGSQTLVRDVITGVFLLLEDAVAVGDVVTLGGLTGVVEHLSIRSIKLRATDGSVHIVPFSAVTTVTNMTRDFAFAVLDVTVAYDQQTDDVVQALRDISTEIRAEAKWKALIRDDIDVFGVEKLADAGVTIRARVKTEPAARWSVGREFNRRIKAEFEARGITIPRPQPMVMVERPPARDPGLAKAAE